MSYPSGITLKGSLEQLSVIIRKRERGGVSLMLITEKTGRGRSGRDSPSKNSPDMTFSHL